MDSLHTIGFYVSAALSVAGGLSVAFLPDRTRRALALGASGLGVAGIYASLSAAFAAVIAIISFAGCAALLAGPGHDCAVRAEHPGRPQPRGSCR